MSPAQPGTSSRYYTAPINEAVYRTAPATPGLLITMWEGRVRVRTVAVSNLHI